MLIRKGKTTSIFGKLGEEAEQLQDKESVPTIHIVSGGEYAISKSVRHHSRL